MQISNIASTLTSPSGTSDTTSAKSTQKNEFLRLLVAQLEQQNPLDPQSGAEFVAQLAQFTEVEQGAQTNETLADIQAGQISDSRAQMAALVGRGVSARVDEVEIGTDGQVPSDVQIHINRAMAKGEVTFTDEAGKVVKRVALGARDEGDFSLDVPKDPPLPAGKYTIAISGVPAGTTGEPSTEMGYAKVRGKIDSVDLTSPEGTLFRVGKHTLLPGAILSVENI